MIGHSIHATPHFSVTASQVKAVILGLFLVFEFAVPQLVGVAFILEEYLNQQKIFAQSSVMSS